MHRIDSTDSAITLPAPNQPGTPGYFTEGNPTTGVEATIVSADFLNAIQEELSFVIESAGLTLSKTDRTQLAQALARLGRLRLTAPLDLYVSNAGSDNNTGLTPATAFASLTHAYQWIRDRIDCNGFQVTVHIANGTYAPLACTYPVVGPPVKFIGNTATPSAVVVNNPTGPAVLASVGANIVVDSFRVTATSPSTDYLQSGSGLLAGSAGYISFNHMDFGTCSNVHIEATTAGAISFPGANGVATISGPSGAFIYAVYGGVATIVDSTITLTGNPAFSYGFATALACGVLQAWGCTFNGTAAGRRYNLASNAACIVQTANASYFPGSLAGVNDGSGIIN